MKSKAPNPEKYALAGTEAAHQIALFMFFSIPENLQQWPEARFLFAIPNGGFRTKIEAARFKAQGVKAGVPDIMLPVKKGKWNGLFIELKRPKAIGRSAGKTSPQQNEWIEFLRDQGYGAAVCEGWEAARDMIVDYLGMR